MDISSHQPSFLPWIGYWNKLANSDVHIFSAGVKFPKENFVNRVRFMGSWLTLPIVHGTGSGPICGVRVTGLREAADRIRFRLCVKRFPYHDRLFPLLNFMDSCDETRLSEINTTTTAHLARVLGLEDLIFKVDRTPPQDGLSKTENLALRVWGHCEPPITYRAGSGAASYLEPAELPFPVLVQNMRTGVSDESIVQLIAERPDPLAHILGAATWSLL